MKADFSKLTAGEEQLVKWQFRMQGDFYSALWKAIMLADEGNLDRLAEGFPDDVDAYKRFSRVSGYWKDVCKRADIDSDLA